MVQVVISAFEVFDPAGMLHSPCFILLTFVDPTDQKTFWINPYAVHFGAINVSDLIHVDEDGNCLSETPHKVNTAGFVIHSEIHKARPDINAACHCHSPYGRAWSTFGKPLEMLNQGVY